MPSLWAAHRHTLFEPGKKWSAFDARTIAILSVATAQAPRPQGGKTDPVPYAPLVRFAHCFVAPPCFFEQGAHQSGRCLAAPSPQRVRCAEGHIDGENNSQRHWHGASQPAQKEHGAKCRGRSIEEPIARPSPQHTPLAWPWQNHHSACSWLNLATVHHVYSNMTNAGTDHSRGGSSRRERTKPPTMPRAFLSHG